MAPRGKVNWRGPLGGPIRPTLLEIVVSPKLLSLRGPEPEGGVTPDFGSISVEDRVARNRKRALEPASSFLETFCRPESLGPRALDPQAFEIGKGPSALEP